MEEEKSTHVPLWGGHHAATYPVALMGSPTTHQENIEGILTVGGGVVQRSAERPELHHELQDQAFRQAYDDRVIEAGLYEEERDARRKRSLKFRAKMRARRLNLFKDAFHKPDRTLKNLNKAAAALRRRRDGTGKFNFEERQVSSVAQSPPRPTFQSRMSNGSSVESGKIFRIEKLSIPVASQNWSSMPCPQE